MKIFNLSGEEVDENLPAKTFRDALNEVFERPKVIAYITDNTTATFLLDDYTQLKLKEL